MLLYLRDCFWLLFTFTITGGLAVKDLVFEETKDMLYKGSVDTKENLKEVKEDFAHMLDVWCAEGVEWFMKEYKDMFTPFEIAKMLNDEFCEMTNDFAKSIYDGYEV